MINSGKLWELIKHFDEEGYLLAVGTPGEDMWSESNKAQSPDGGLVPGHAYTII